MSQTMTAVVLDGPGAPDALQLRERPLPVPRPGAALTALLARLVSEHGVDPVRVFLLGFSQGAIIGASVALTRPDRVAGLVMLSGRILTEARPGFAPAEALQQTAVFVAHGVHDTQLGIHHGRATQALLAEPGVPTTDCEYDMAHEITAAELSDVDAWLTARLASLA